MEPETFIHSSVLVYGSGSMARVVGSYLAAEGRLAGFAVEDAVLSGERTKICGIEAVPWSRVPEVFDCTATSVLPAIGYADMNRLRERVIGLICQQGYQLATYVHPTVCVGYECAVGEGSILLDHVSVHAGCHIGKGVFISSNVNIGHDVEIGDFCFINSGVAIAGWSRLGSRCFLGINSSIGDSIRIGAANYIGANTLVVRSTGDEEVWISASADRFRSSSSAFLRYLNDQQTD